MNQAPPPAQAMSRMVVDSDNDGKDDVAAPSSPATAARGEHDDLEPMNTDEGSRSGHKRKVVDGDEREEEDGDEREEEDGDDCGDGSGTLMRASLNDALNMANVPDDLRTRITDNVSKFEKLFETKKASNADKMMQLVNDTREKLQTHCVDRLDGRYRVDLKRAQVIAPPGFGKSRLAGMLIERRFKGTNGQMIVAILVPTIELVKQFWRCLDPKADDQSVDHPFPGLRSVKFLRLCSAEDERRGDAAGATTDLNAALSGPAVAGSMVREDGSVGPPRLVIISTYQSCKLLSEVLETRMVGKGCGVDKASNWVLDLLVCDEAHKTACNSASREAYWKMPLEDAWVPARQRLFLTATPKIDLGSSDEEDGGETGDGDEVLHADMSDEAVYGPKVFELRVEHGIALRVLRDIEIRVVVVQGEQVKALLKDADKNKATMAHLVSQMSAVRHALDSIENERRKGFVFTSRIFEVNELHKSEKLGSILNGYQRFKNHSGMSTKKNTEQLEAMRKSNRALMLNCQSLGLGLDLPEAALVAILSGMTSWEVLVQAVGRVLRQCASLIFQRAVVVLPILLVEGEEDEDAAAAAKKADVSTKVRGKQPPPKKQKQSSQKKKQSTTTAGDQHQTSKIVKVLLDELPWIADDLNAMRVGRKGKRLSIEALNVKVTEADLVAVRDGVVSETLGRQMSKVRQAIADKVKALTKLSVKPTQKKEVPVRRAKGGEMQVDLGQFWDSIRLNFGPDPEKANTKLSEEQKNTLLGVKWVKEEARKMAAEAAKPPEVKATKADKLKALTKLSVKPTCGKTVPVRRAKGGEMQVDLGGFWNSIRLNFGPEQKTKGTKLSEEQKNTLLGVKWVKEEARKMAAEAAKPPEVKATIADKLKALTKLSVKPTRGKEVPVRRAKGGEAQVDLGGFWNSIRPNFSPKQKTKGTQLSEEEKNTLLVVKWVKEEARKMAAEAAKPPEVKATKADKLKALTKLSVKPTCGKTVPVRRAKGGEAQVDLGGFWDSIRLNFSPEQKTKGTKLSEEEKNTLLVVKWVKEEARKMAAEAAKPPEVKATKADKFKALTKLSVKPTWGKEVPVRRAKGGEAQVDLGGFWSRIRPNFGPDPEKASTQLSEEEKNTLLGVKWVKEEARKMAAEAAKPPEVKATKADKFKALTKLSVKPTWGKEVPVRRAKGGEAQVDLGGFWSRIRPNFGPDPEKASTQLSEEEKNTLLGVKWVKEEARKMIQRI